MLVVDDFGEYNNLVRDYLTGGFLLVHYDENSASLKRNGHGSLKNHLLLLILTGWWSFGLINLIYFIYSYLTDVEAYKILFNSSNNDFTENIENYSYDFDDVEYISNYLLSYETKNSESNNGYQNDSKSPIVSFLED